VPPGTAGSGHGRTGAHWFGKREDHMRKPIVTILAGFVALFAFSAPADAAPAGGKRPAVRSVCETGYRGMPAYDRLCLTRGTGLVGVILWFRSVYSGKLSPARDRGVLCLGATATGHARAGIIDALNDVAYDHFRNYRLVLSVAGTVG